MTSSDPTSRHVPGTTATAPPVIRRGPAPAAPAARVPGPGTGHVRTAGGPAPDDGEAHLLRLCLDLQLDAMLLTLGAAAAAPGASPDGTPDTGADARGHAPWRRWVSEDVDLARSLAVGTLAGGAALPATLGSDLHHAVPATTIDNLQARYASMRSLLADLLARAGSTHRGADLRAALERCEHRLEELQAFRLTATPPRGLDLSADHGYLPGELLG
jgi:hypothetical protein